MKSKKYAMIIFATGRRIPLSVRAGLVRAGVDIVFKQIEHDFDRHVERARRLVRQPSVSATGEGIQACAELVAGLIEEVGGRASLVATPGSPIVLGELWAGRPVTLLLYGMYDVQPASEEGWTVPPFEGAILTVPPLGECLVARGATNSKGPLAGFLNAVEAYARSGEPLPVNLLFMIEGEEELGSPSLPAFVAERRAELQRAQAVYFAAFREYRSGVAYIQLGTKGQLFLELRVGGGAWGGPVDRAIHGAYGALVANPAWRAVHMLASLVDREDRVRIPGFYDKVLPPDRDDEAALRDLAAVLTPTVLLDEFGVQRLRFDEDPAGLLRHLMFDPILNLSGLKAGYTDPGTKSIVPHEVTVRCEFRLSPGMQPEAVAQALKAHLASSGFDDVTVRVLATNPGSKVSVREPVAQALLRAYQTVGVAPYVHPLNPGWAPLYLFSEVLQRPYVLGGLGRGERAHSADELCTLDGLKRFELCAAAFLRHLAAEIPTV